MIVQPGPGSNFVSSIYVPDAGRALRAALAVSPGIYNVVDDNPLRFKDYLHALAEAMGVPKPFRVPAAFGKLMFGEVWKYVSRSLRVSNARLRQVSNWKPDIPSAAQGWALVAAEMAGQKTPVAA